MEHAPGPSRTAAPAPAQVHRLHVNGRPYCVEVLGDTALLHVLRCMTGLRITTLEGLGTPGFPGPTQQAFIDCQAAQCGYCLNGMIMTTEALLRRNPAATESELRNEIHHNLCRCGTHVEILQAARLAAVLRAAVAPAPCSAISTGPGP